jgi:hypothetical protein
MKLCFLLLHLALLGTHTTPVSGAAVVATSTTRRNEENNIVVPSRAMLARCPKACGNLSFAYPFGIGSGCFRAPEFNLTCVDGGIPRILFVDGITEVIDGDTSEPSGIDVGWSQLINIAYNSTIPVVSGVDVYNMSSWSPPGRSFVLFDSSINVMACGFDVYLLDHDTGTSSNVCSTTCPGGQMTETAALQNCNGTWCCSVSFFLNFYGFQFSFVRRRGEDDGRVVDHSSPLWNKISVTTNYARLLWRVLDQPTCADAEGDAATYACISNHSSCHDPSWTHGGYQCSCNGGYLGNPYVPDGCSRDKGNCSLFHFHPILSSRGRSPVRASSRFMFIYLTFLFLPDDLTTLFY